MKFGDKVRFLNDVGGGTVSGFQGKDIVLVSDADGFDIPMPIHECIVVETDNYNISRPEKKGPEPVVEKTDRGKGHPHLHPIEEADDPDDDERPITFRPQAVERLGGNQLNVFLAFVPQDTRTIDSTGFEAYLINDCNYTVHFALLSHDEGTACSLRHEGEVEANTKLHLEDFKRDDLSSWERLPVQLMAFKRRKSFLPKAPVNVGLRIDGTKFYKLGTFAPNEFFDERALIVDVIRDDKPVRSVFVKAEEVKDVLTTPKAVDRPLRQPARKHQPTDPTIPIEVDLHADALLETTAGLSSADILEYQLKTFRETMNAHLKERGRKLIFIHGKGEGVLRTALTKELKTHYKQCRWQDASFREYGFGATMVII